MVGTQLGTRGVGCERDQQTRAQRKQFLKHDRQSPDPPRVWPSVPERPASASKNFTFGDGVFETSGKITPLLGYAGVKTASPVPICLLLSDTAFPSWPNSTSSNSPIRAC